MKTYSALILLTVESAITMTATAQESSSPIPDGSSSKISDWALAGVIWSDASLTKKLASQAAKEADSPDQAASFKKLSQQSSKTVEAMETFGWKQVKRTANLSGNPAPQSGSSEKPLPDPEKVGAALAESLGLSETKPSDSSSRTQSTQTAQAPTLDPSIKSFDTETPAGRDDPGMDDERTGDGFSLDVDNYRVDDYIDG